MKSSAKSTPGGSFDFTYGCRVTRCARNVECVNAGQCLGLPPSATRGEPAPDDFRDPLIPAESQPSTTHTSLVERLDTMVAVLMDKTGELPIPDDCNVPALMHEAAEVLRCMLSEIAPMRDKDGFPVLDMPTWNAAVEQCAMVAWNHEPDVNGPIETAIRALKGTTPSAIRESEPDEDGERYRWFRNECSWARRSDIVDVAAEEPDLLDHHIDKGRCGL